MVYKAVLFDSTGVIMSYDSSPYLAEFMSKAKKVESIWKIWADMELGKLNAKEVNDVFQPMLDANPKLKEQVLKSMTNDTILSIFDNLREDEYFVPILPKLRSAGIKSLLLTNQMWRDDDRTEVFIPATSIAKFDANVISCRDGVRKPDADIFLVRFTHLHNNSLEQIRLFQLAAKKLSVEPKECIFIDDFPENCEGARKVGMAAIQVHGTDTKTAVQELEKMLNLKLLL
ncbi:unnamed protein product [Anisakis simplex]|uniref:Acyl-CoA dehydrogenase family member 10 (inferred by orthology to a human protein) n=1 Tax=Anisakis simplex TaxID=6269 RepID=A0A0M3IY89_ANISI|nr:unnamed protein product [Anisakis simplex]